VSLFLEEFLHGIQLTRTHRRAGQYTQPGLYDVRWTHRTTTIIGPRTMAQLVDNLAEVEIEISDDDQAKIDALVPPGSVISPFYEADFGPHPHRT